MNMANFEAANFHYFYYVDYVHSKASFKFIIVLLKIAVFITTTKSKAKARRKVFILLVHSPKVCSFKDINTLEKKIFY